MCFCIHQQKLFQSTEEINRRKKIPRGGMGRKQGKSGLAPLEPLRFLIWSSVTIHRSGLMGGFLLAPARKKLH